MAQDQVFPPPHSTHFTALDNSRLADDRLEGVLEIRNSEIDGQDLMRRIRENAANRKDQGVSLSTLLLSEQRLALRAVHESLRVRVQMYGTIGEAEPGIKGKIQFFFKRVILKLIRRHIDQEKDVQESLLKFVERLIPYLDQAQFAAECLQRIEKLEKQLKAQRDPD